MFGSMRGEAAAQAAWHVGFAPISVPNDVAEPPLVGGVWYPTHARAAPAFGFAFDKTGVVSVRVPVQLWRAAADHHQPNPWYEEVVRGAAQATEYHVVPDADHYAFLAPCSPELAAAAAQICTDPPGFDRAAFHRNFNAEVVRFFSQTLPIE